MERLPLTNYQRLIFAVIATAYLFDSMDLAAMTFLLGSIRKEFGLSGADAGFLASLSFFGMFFGAMAAGVLADKIGRKAVFQISILFWGVGSFACGFSHDLLQLQLARVLLGIGMGMEYPIAQSLMSELVPTKHRGRYVAFLQGFWPIGFVCAGFLAAAVFAYTPDWRWVFIFEGIPVFCVLYIRTLVPESPRWLASQGRMAEADKVLSGIESKVQASYGAPLPPPQPVPPVEGGSTGLAALWSRGYAKRTTMVWGHWFFTLLGFYGMLTWIGALLQQKGFPVTQSVYYTTLISMAGIPGFLFSGWLVEVIGRKKTFAGLLLASAVACYLYGAATTETTVIIFGLLMQFCQFGMGSALYAYTPELYPTRMRATGAGFASAAGRVGALIGPYIVGVVLPSYGQSGVFALGAAAFVISALLVIVLGEETKGKTLEEISDARDTEGTTPVGTSANARA